MSDAPRLSPADELNRQFRHATLFERVTARRLKALLEEAVRRMNGIGDNAETEYQRAIAALREAGGEAVDALGQELDALGPAEYVNRWAVTQLLHDLEDPRALKALDRLIASAIPEERSKDPHSSTAGKELVVRTTAVEAVSRLAARGNADARRALLKYVGHPVRSVKIAAALAYAEHGGSAARKELEERMPKTDHWILEIQRMHPAKTTPIAGHRDLPPRSTPESVGVPRPAGGGVPGKGAAGAGGGRSGRTDVPAPRAPTGRKGRNTNKKTRGR